MAQRLRMDAVPRLRRPPGSGSGGTSLSRLSARLPDLCDVAERVLQCHARFGLAVGIRDWPESLRDPEWATAAGLAMYSAKLKMQAANERESAGWLGRVLR